MARHCVPREYLVGILWVSCDQCVDMLCIIFWGMI